MKFTVWLFVLLAVTALSYSQNSSTSTPHVDDQPLSITSLTYRNGRVVISTNKPLSPSVSAASACERLSRPVRLTTDS